MSKVNTESEAQNVTRIINEIKHETGLGDTVRVTAENIVTQLQSESTLLSSHRPSVIAVASVLIAQEYCTSGSKNTVIEIRNSDSINLPHGSSEVVETVKQRIADALDIEIVETPTEYLNTVCNNSSAQIPENVIDESERILSGIDSETIMGMRKQTITGATLYAACLLTRTPMAQETISEVSSASKNSIQTNYRHILNTYSGHNIPENVILNAHHFELLKSIKNSK